MGYLQRLYQKVLSWSGHPRAPCYLAGMSVAESSFFPVPPDALLIPMVMAKPERGWFYALLTTLSSVFGGILGYMIGYFALEWVGMPILQTLHAESYFAQITDWFTQWGFWVIFLAGVTPIPYKVFTIAAGAFQLSLPMFIIASLVGRAVRFFGVVSILKLAGQKVDALVVRYIDRIGWGILLGTLILIVVLKYTL